MTRHRDHDVLIAGAGPAGTHLALRLARAGWSVGLLERRPFPRQKPCGEFLSPECLPLLEELGLRAEVLARGARALRGMRIYRGARVARGVYAAVGDAAAAFDHGYGIRREVLDDLALARARDHGVRVYAEHAVSALLRRPDGAVRGLVVRRAREGERAAPLELLAPFTIGADGLQSRVARELGVQRWIPWLSRYAVVARFGGVAPSEHAEVHLLEDGYFAAAPVEGDVFTVNLVLGRGALPSDRGALEAFFAERLRRVPALAERIGAASPLEPLAVCGPLARSTSAQVFDGAALVGDACGFVDPLTGEGLFFAMRGAALRTWTDRSSRAVRRCAGALAGEALRRGQQSRDRRDSPPRISGKLPARRPAPGREADLDRALHAGRCDREALRGYARARRREFGAHDAAARLLQRGLARPRVVAAVHALLAARPRLADLVVSVTGDYVPFRELLRPSVWRQALRRGPSSVEPRSA